MGSVKFEILKPAKALLRSIEEEECFKKKIVLKRTFFSVVSMLYAGSGCFLKNKSRMYPPNLTVSGDYR